MIFPHPDRQEWVADWGLTGGEVDHTVEKLSLYMSFLTEWYIVMGQMLDNAPEEQLEVIRRFTEEHSSGRLPSTITSWPRSLIVPPHRRPASLEVTVRGPDRREVTYSTSSAVSGTAPRQTFPAPPGPQAAANHRPVAPQMCLQPPCGGHRLHKGRLGQLGWGHLIGLYQWQPPGIQSRGRNRQ